MRILYVVGTRPNFVKTAPVIAALRARLPDGRHTIVHTGQHYDRLLSRWAVARRCAEAFVPVSYRGSTLSSFGDWGRRDH